jgi:hypothetical protein
VDYTQLLNLDIPQHVVGTQVRPTLEEAAFIPPPLKDEPRGEPPARDRISRLWRSTEASSRRRIAIEGPVAFGFSGISENWKNREGEWSVRLA